MGLTLMLTNKTITSLTIVFFFLITCQHIHAAPGSLSVLGDIDDGQSVTITGSDFGSKSQGPPELWDNFENASNGSSLSGRSPTVGAVNWGTIGSPVASNANQRTNSTLSYFGDFSSGVYNNSIYYLRTETTTGAKKYFSFWWRAGRAGGMWSRNMKPWQHYGSSLDQPMYYIGDGTGDGDPGFRSNVIDNSTALSREGNIYGCGDMASIEHQWIRWEGYIVLSDPGVQNGRMEVWRSQPNTITRSNCIHHPTAVTRSTANGFRQWAFGEYMSTAYERNSVVYMDDIYIDNTLARVELCDASTWASVSHCEVQPATAWSASSIAITVNTGAFSESDTAYIYVVDVNGDANATGYEVTVGESNSSGTGMRISAEASMRVSPGATPITIQ